MAIRVYVFALVFALFASPIAAPAQTPYIFQNPTLSRTQIAFEWGGDIWTVSRSGGRAQRLVTGFDLEGAPYFSPDGSKIAFSGNYDGNIDVYVVPSSGGEPRRLTYHPGADVAVGWTPDGKNVLFRSGRVSYADENMLYTVPAAGGFPKALPLAMAEDGSFSPDASHMAYVPTAQWEPQWQHYRGGQTTPVWIANLADSSIVKVPRENSNDRNPMWIGNTVYFLSDRNGPATLYAYDTATRAVRRLVGNTGGFDILSANAGPGGIVYTQLGSLHLYDIATAREHTVPVTMAADMPQLRAHWMKVEDQIQNAAISPTGVRAVFEAHGDIFTVPAQHGDVRNLTQTPGAAERDPAWSPDGRSIAYFSDSSGEYALHVIDQKGLHPARVIALPSPSFFYTPVWSPDSKKIAYDDKHGNLWYIDVGAQHPTPEHVAVAPYETFGAATFNVSWSPDSRWIAYNNQLANYLNAIFVYSLDDRRSTQITDGMSDSRNPAFDKSGKYLYFLASTNTGLTTNGLDMAGDERPTSSDLYAAVLQDSAATPIAPQTADEPVTDEPEASAASPAPRATPREKPAMHDVRIDFTGILQRIVALPVPNANYVAIAAGEPGEVYLLQAPLTSVQPEPPRMTVLKFNAKARTAMPLAQGVSTFALSANGKKMLIQQGPHWSIASTEEPVKDGEGAIDTGAMEIWSVPSEEWAQMYRETWRIERDFFYDKHYGGLNIAQAQRRFAEFLPGLGSRDDLTFLTKQMLSYLSTGHMWVRGGTEPDLHRVTTGLLGADYTIENGRYRFSKIYDGENWNPRLTAPLTQPGATVHPGEYLLAVNGRPLHGGDNIYFAFEETAGKQTSITVGPNADGAGSRTITVVPVRSEFSLRNYAWIEGNRREVDRLSGGKLGYVYLPDTEYGGFTNFNRYFFSQVDKQGVILDERFNHGGQIADYIIDVLSRKPMSVLVPRDGKRMIDPPLAIYGPKVMIINQYAGSGGDAMPWYFRKANIGPLVGVRTWGGLVGIGGYPALMDGGSVMAPRIAIGGLHGHWEVEGHGIAPDVEVQQDPKLMREGRDPQLEAAVDTALRMLREHPVPQFAPPPYPDHHEVLPH